MFLLIFTFGTALLSVFFYLMFFRAFRGVRWWWHAAVITVLVLLTASRFIARRLSMWGWDGAFETYQFVSVLWLIILFWFLCINVAIGAWNLLVYLAGKIRPFFRKVTVKPRACFIASMMLISFGCVWGLVEASNVRVQRVVLETDKLPASRDSLRVAMITDMHIGSSFSDRQVSQTVQLLEALQPDLVVCTGDFFDGDLNYIAPMAKPFKNVTPPLGKYAVLGNHDCYAGADGSAAAMESVGFSVLRQRTACPVEGLRLVGVDDPSIFRWNHAGDINEVPFLPGNDRNELVILLKHRPEINYDAVGKFDLQLSGHTHGGQIFPMGLMVRMRHKFCPGLHELGEGSKLYLSCGTGTWGIPLRVASPPEVVLIEFKRPGKAEAISDSVAARIK